MITRNVLHNNPGGGLRVETNGAPTVLRNCFTHNGPFEMCFDTNSAARVLENDVHLADTVGMLYTSCASGEALRNRVVESKGCGIVRCRCS